ncbi:MAG: secondary thiamine-phosphate synthase enzyme YjbQ [Candidatus Binataceae bacterium]
MHESSASSRLTLRATLSQSRHLVMLSNAILEVATKHPIEFIDLTERINAHLRAHEIEHGEVTIFSRHTTAAIKINEAEELLLEDFKRLLRRLCPPEHSYDHNDMSRRKPPIAVDERPNAHSHCMHLLLSTSETIPVIDTRLALGTWQRVFLVELDGPRRREVFLRFTQYLPHQSARAIGAVAVNGYQNGNRSSRGLR